MGQHRLVAPRRRTAVATVALLAASTVTLVVALPAASSGATPLASDCAADTTTPALVHCTYTTPGEHVFSVPAGATSLDVSAVGASGGRVIPNDVPGSTFSGGVGGTAAGTYRIPAGTTTLYAEVGGVGTDGALNASGGGNHQPGGYNGGGSGNENSYSASYAATGAGGGGASDLRTVSETVRANSAVVDSASDPRLLSAAGGGGANPFSDGGAAGQPGKGADVPPAGAGTAASGGTGGDNTAQNAGTRTSGGDAEAGFGIGGGGGGGWFGGGAGTLGSGAGGANFVTSALTAANTGTATGPAEVEISYTRVGPTLAATAGSSGHTVTDRATVTGTSAGGEPGGTVTFELFAPSDTTCDGTPLYTVTNDVAAGSDSSVTASTSYDVTASGTYTWTASFSGDGSYAPASTACSASGQKSTVATASKVTPTLSTQATPSTAPHGVATDHASLSGSNGDFDGTIIFTLYAGDDATCTGTAVGTDTEKVGADGSTQSDSVTVGAAGFYHWTAAYSGGTNYNAVTEGCGGTGETTTVGTVPRLSTFAVSLPYPQPIYDTARLDNGSTPTGTVTFRVYGPDDATCSRAPFATVSGSVGPDNGATDYAAVAPAVVDAPTGTYRWIASYSGDDRNTPVAGRCNDAQELSTVAAAASTLGTGATDAVIGGSIHDTAHVTDDVFGDVPSGTVTFKVYAPDDTTCSTALQSFDVALTDARATSPDVTTTELGTYRWVASYSGDSHYAGATGRCGDDGESSVVGRATPGLTTRASDGIVGQAIRDTATVTGTSPTGTVTFSVFAPGDTACGTALATSKVTLDGGTATSPDYTATKVGVYRWVASYGGDGSNAAAAGACGDAGEYSGVSQATATLTTKALDSTVGNSIKDTATVTGYAPAGSTPAGTVTFYLYGPGNTDCTSTALQTSVVTLTNGTATSPGYTSTQPGDYRWIAFYNGDDNNIGTGGTCGEDGEISHVSQRDVGITSLASGAAVGGTIGDQASLSNSYEPTGSMTFTLYAPGDTTCTTAVGTYVVPLAKESATVSGVAVSSTGTYRWIASYPGDADNKAVVGSCGEAGESSVVVAASPSLSSKASDGVVGGTISDTATLAGGYHATGSIHFLLYGPGDDSCENEIVAQFDGALSSDGTTASVSYTPTATGTYRWIAQYKGDSANGFVAGACNDAGESSTVGRAQPSLTTEATVTTTAGGSAQDVATVTGGASATGTVTFTLYGPDDSDCTGPVYGVDDATLTDGTASSVLLPVGGVGIYHWTARYGGDAGNASVAEGCDGDNESTTVTATSPTITTSATASVVYGQRPGDTATLAGTYQQTGTISFTLYAGTDCTDPVGSTTVTVDPATATYSADVPTLAPGVYHWRAVYSGDANNGAAHDGCDEDSEQVTVTKAPLTISTAATADATAGGSAADTATVTSPAPTGKVTFTLYGPGDTDCTAAPIGTDIESVATDGTATSVPISVGAVGQYRWRAAYDGDAYTESGTAPCNADGESTTVTPATSSITSHASDGTVGGTITDQATLTGGYRPAGTVTFRVYAPGDTDCTGDTVATSTVTLSDEGTAQSPAAAVSHAGAYHWVAAYSGDANNLAATGTCGDADETSTVAQQAPSFTAVARPQKATVGQRLSDVATLIGDPPTGTITFRLYAGATCSGNPVHTVSLVAHGSGRFTSPTVTVSRPGRYRWKASYAGDADHLPATTACGDLAQAVLVLAGRTPPTTPPTTPTHPVTPTHPATPTHGSHGRDLSVTGTPAGPLALAGLLLVLLGTVLAAAAHRRRGHRA